MRDFLRPLLTDYREWVEAAWSAQTAHEDYAGAPGSPVGQCGVTSAWLQHRLNADHGIATTLCRGAIYTAPRDLADAGHCWLEHDGVVIDLTADQFGLPPVTCDTYEDLILRDWVYYLPQFTGPAEDPLLARLAVLEGALS